MVVDHFFRKCCVQFSYIRGYSSNETAMDFGEPSVSVTLVRTVHISALFLPKDWTSNTRDIGQQLNEEYVYCFVIYRYTPSLLNSSATTAASALKFSGRKRQIYKSHKLEAYMSKKPFQSKQCDSFNALFPSSNYALGEPDHTQAFSSGQSWLTVISEYCQPAYRSEDKKREQFRNRQCCSVLTYW